MKPVIARHLDGHTGIPPRVLLDPIGRPRVSNGLTWVPPAATRDDWVLSVPAIGEDIGSHFFVWLYS